MTLRTSRVLAAAVLFAVFALVTPALAQQYTGRIDVSIEDATGARMPGVNIEITGPMNQTMVTDARGEAHFLNLNVGVYQVKTTIAGFNEYRNTNITVVAGGSVPLAIKLAVAGTKETVQVTAEAPVIDTKKQGTATSVTLDELQNVPTARDPWVVMQTVPGIVMDRVNVGGSESGQQAGFMGKGASSGQTTWNIDGMPITDMSSLSSPFYFDFDAYQEMSVSTGGADIKSATGGIQLNMMLKSGTNNFHGNGKYYIETPGMQSNNMDPNLATTLKSGTGKGDQTEQFKDWGGDLGGPIVKDRLWFWGAWGDQDIRILKMAGATDRTVLRNATIKVQGQLTKSIRGSFSFFQAEKLKWGRNAGAFYTQPSTVDQSGAGGANRFWKGEINYVAGNDFFLVGRYARVKGGFQLIPEGGSSTPAYTDVNGVWHNSQSTYITQRPQDAVSVDANYFKGMHELKFGFTWRKAPVHSTSTWGGDWYTDAVNNGVGANSGVQALTAGADLLAAVNAPYATDVSATYYNLYIGDTITMKRATINLGVRYDRQLGSVLPSVEAAPANINNLLPSITAPGIDGALTFGLLQPRVGFTYAVDENRKTQLRATYAMFTDQIGSGAAGFLSVATYRGFYVDAKDANGDHIAEPNEIIWSSYAAHIANGDYWGYNPNNPSATPTSSINKVGNYGVPRTHEIIFGVDHELMPNFGVSASFTWRRIMDLNWRPIISGSGYLDGTDYVQTTTATGTLPSGIDGSPTGTYAVPYYALIPGTAYDPSKGGVYTAHPDYHQSYKGFELTATKRMSNKWMARLGFSTNVWREYYDALDGHTNPTPLLSAPNISGGYVVNAASGSGKSQIYMVMPKYQITANGAYQLPHDIDIGGSYMIRQGYPMPWNGSFTASGSQKDPLGSSKTILLPSDFAWARLPAEATLDARVGKRFRYHTVNFNFDLDVFNILNSATVLGRQYSANSAAYTNIAEIMQPRIARLGLRITF